MLTCNVKIKIYEHVVDIISTYIALIRLPSSWCLILYRGPFITKRPNVLSPNLTKLEATRYSFKAFHSIQNLKGGSAVGACQNDTIALTHNPVASRLCEILRIVSNSSVSKLSPEERYMRFLLSV